MYLLKSVVLFSGLFQVGVASRSVNQAAENLQYMHMKTCMPIEEHAQSILTPYAFNVLQHEMVLSLQYAMTEMANGSYLVRHYKNWIESVS